MSFDNLEKKLNVNRNEVVFPYNTYLGSYLPGRFIAANCVFERKREALIREDPLAERVIEGSYLGKRGRLATILGLEAVKVGVYAGIIYGLASLFN